MSARKDDAPAADQAAFIRFNEGLKSPTKPPAEGFMMDACPTVTHGVTRSSLHQLPELQRMPGEYWHLQGLASRVACSGGVQ